MAFREDDLGCEILWRPTEGPRSVVHLLCKPEVSHLAVTITVKQQILRLEIAV